MKKNKYVYLEDYVTPSYLVKQVVLDFCIDKKKTVLKSEFTLQANKMINEKEDLILDGENIKLKKLSINGRKINLKNVIFKKDIMIISKNLINSQEFTIEMENHIDPSSNKSLEGLYLSNDIICTQCEPEGFRKICYSIDRPDVLATYKVRLRGPYRCLLSNGNQLKKSSYFAEWYDPFPKPTYLFAIVAGDLNFHQDEFITMNKKRVSLRIYHKDKDKGKTYHAMNCLKNVMRWDEIHYQREYDLDTFMIVAIDDFNAGAMENKGLNIFNSKYVLYDEERSTDTDFKFIEAIIAHEYFHNWTGNRITCRDWFQLCLKEGLTVFREQEYMAQGAKGLINRVEEVEFLLKNQFPEDAGPLSHAVRPSKYKEINNFYTATVYEKGAEIIRMLKIIAGEKIYKKALQKYFSKHDGKASTVEDLQEIFEDCLGMNLSNFFNWYSESGTPRLRVDEQYCDGIYEAEITQELKNSRDKSLCKVIPIVYSIINQKGDDLVASKLLVHDKPKKTISLKYEKEKPTLSLFRGFSAPVIVEFKQSESDLKNILSNEKDFTSIWLAKDKLDYLCLHKLSDADREANSFVKNFVKILTRNKKNLDLLSKLITPPTEHEYFTKLCSTEKHIDPEVIVSNLKAYKNQFSREIYDYADSYLTTFLSKEKFLRNHSSISERSFAIAVLKHKENIDNKCTLAKKMFKLTDSMTLKIACLSILIAKGKGEKQLNSFYCQYQDDRSLMDKWFSIQVQFCPPKQAETIIKSLCEHKKFKLLNPNNFNSVITTFAKKNFSGFNLKNGKGYQLVTKWIKKIDTFNPQVAARATKTFEHISFLPDHYSCKALKPLKDLQRTKNLSKDTSEIIENIITGCKRTL